MLQVTFVWPPSGAKSNAETLFARIGRVNSSLNATRSGVSSMISIRPAPALLLPFHSYTEPTPFVGPENVRCIAGSSFSYGDHAAHSRKSSMCDAITFGGAAMRDERWTRKMLGRVAA